MSLERLWQDAPSDALALIRLAPTHASARFQLTPALQRLGFPASFLDDLRVIGKFALELTCAEFYIDRGGQTPSQLELSAPALGRSTRDRLSAYIVSNDLATFGPGVAPEERSRSAIQGDLANQLLGALAYTCGLQVIRKLLETLRPIEDGSETIGKDPKTTLQEILQAQRKSRPIYTTIAESGPAHAAEFVVQVSTTDGKSAKGKGSKRKYAEAAAATEYLRMHCANRGAGKSQHAPHGVARNRPSSPRLGPMANPDFLRTVSDEFDIPQSGLATIRLSLARGSFAGEAEESKYGRDNRLLAALGARALTWAIADVVCRCALERPRSERMEAGISLVFTAVRDPQTMSSICRNLDLQRNLIGPAVPKDRLHPALATEAVQAFVGALFEVRRPNLRYGYELLNSRRSLLIDPIRERIRVAMEASRSSLLPKKTLLQERCQAVGLRAVFSRHVEGSNETSVELRGVDGEDQLTVSMRRLPSEGHRDAEGRLTTLLIDAFDFSLGTLREFSSTLSPDARLCRFFIDRLVKFTRHHGPRATLNRIERIADLGLLGTRMLDTKFGSDFVRWWSQLHELMTALTDGKLDFLEEFYAGLGQFSLTESTLGSLAADTLGQASSFLASVDPLTCPEDVRNTAAFSAVADFARISRLLSGTIAETSLLSLKSELELLARGRHHRLSVSVVGEDAKLIEVRGSFIAVIYLAVDIVRSALGSAGDLHVELRQSASDLLIDIAATDGGALNTERLLPVLEDSQQWRFLRELIPIAHVEGDRGVLRIAARSKADGGVHDFVRRLRWTSRYGVLAKEGSPLVEIAGALHDVKNEMIAFQAAAEAARRASAPAERYRFAADASAHAELGMGSLARANAVLGAMQQTQLQTVDIGEFFRGYSVELMSWLPSRLSLVPPTTTCDAKVEFDTLQLRSLLTNLCRNSAEAMQSGGRLGLEWLFDTTTGDLEIELWDTGPGIPMDQLDKLNAKEPIRSTKPKGSGVGLLSVLLSVESLGGRIRFESRQRGGLLVRMTIPTVLACVTSEGGQDVARSVSNAPRVEVG